MKSTYELEKELQRLKDKNLRLRDQVESLCEELVDCTELKTLLKRLVVGRQ